MDNKVRIILIAVLVGAVLLTIFRIAYPETEWTEVLSIVVIISILVSYSIEKVIFNRTKDKADD